MGEALPREIGTLRSEERGTTVRQPNQQMSTPVRAGLSSGPRVHLCGLLRGALMTATLIGPGVKCVSTPS